MNNTPQTPMVSVWMITYNHEPFIAQAIESVLMQKTTFPIELVIGEDCSTDGTAAIVKEYADKYPHIIRARFNQPNLGMMPNVIKTLEECQGKYIALLEGDDYWTDELKLQKQVDFLTDNSNCTMTCSHGIIVDSKGKFLSDRIYKESIIGTYDILSGFIPPTNTIMFRNIPGLSAFLTRNIDFPSGDRLIAYYISLMGDIHILHQKTAAYRVSGIGVWSCLNEDQQFYISIERFIEFHLRLGLPIDNFLINRRVNNSIWFVFKNKPKSFMNEYYKIRRILDAYEVRNRFCSFLWKSFLQKVKKSLLI